VARRQQVEPDLSHKAGSAQDAIRAALNALDAEQRATGVVEALAASLPST
jgi:hypothetical protein